jgi:hypothetical protein
MFRGDLCEGEPRHIVVAAHDRHLLQRIARSRTLSWFQVQRARTLLAVADGERVQTVATWMQCDPSTIRRICRRYEESGLESVLAEAPRTGRPADISPSGTRPDGATGLSGAHRQGIAHHPLE